MGEAIVWNVDTQKDFMYSGWGLYVPDAENIIPNLKGVFESAMANNIKVLGSADEHNKKSPELIRNGGPFPDHCMKGTDGQLNIPETLFPEGQVGIVHWEKRYKKAMLEKLFSYPQVILTKDTTDVHKKEASPYVDALLATIKPDTTIYVIGVATEYCVLCALQGLVAFAKKNNCRVAVVEDAIKPITKEGERTALDKYRKLGVQFVRASEAIAHFKSLNAQISYQSTAKFITTPTDAKRGKNTT